MFLEEEEDVVKDTFVGVDDAHPARKRKPVTKNSADTVFIIDIKA